MPAPPTDPLTPARRRLLLAIAEWTDAHGWAPSTRQMQHVLGTNLSPTAKLVRYCEKAGLLSRGEGKRGEVAACYRRPLRLTPRARFLVGGSLAVYVAWPMPRIDCGQHLHDAAWGRGMAVTRWLLERDRRAVAISPYLTRHTAENRPALDAVARSLAQRADAVLVFDDPVLLGRHDVAAADASGVVCALVRGREDFAAAEAGEDLWGARFRAGRSIVRGAGTQVLLIPGRKT